MASERDYKNVNAELCVKRIVNKHKENRDQMSPMEEQTLKEILQKIKQWKPYGTTNHEMPRIVVFGKYGSGKSSLLNSLSWVMKFENKDNPGEFIETVPCSRQRGIHGGGNTNRLLIHNVGGIMDFVDTKGFPAGAVRKCRLTDEIKQICGGCRSFTKDISWDDEVKSKLSPTKLTKLFTLSSRRMDFAVLVVGARHEISEEYQEAIRAIKDGTGCAPLIVVTSKSEVEGEETEMHSHLTGIGSSRAVFVNNYLIDDEGEGPTDDDVDFTKHLALCKVIQNIQRDYDQHLRAVRANRIEIGCKTVGKCIICLIVIAFITVCVILKIYQMLPVYQNKDSDEEYIHIHRNHRYN